VKSTQKILQADADYSLTITSLLQSQLTKVQIQTPTGSDKYHNNQNNATLIFRVTPKTPDLYRDKLRREHEKSPANLGQGKSPFRNGVNF
jgi:hypothetical protein